MPSVGTIPPSRQFKPVPECSFQAALLRLSTPRTCPKHSRGHVVPARSHPALAGTTFISAHGLATAATRPFRLPAQPETGKAVGGSLPGQRARHWDREGCTRVRAMGLPTPSLEPVALTMPGYGWLTERSDLLFAVLGDLVSPIRENVGKA